MKKLLPIFTLATLLLPAFSFSLPARVRFTAVKERHSVGPIIRNQRAIASRHSVGPWVRYRAIKNRHETKKINNGHNSNLNKTKLNLNTGF